MKHLIVLPMVLLITGTLSAHEIDTALFNGYDAAFVLYDRAAKTSVNIDPARSARRISPCSTFKIYNTLIGLELGLIPDTDRPWYRWDGIKRDYPDWNHDLTLREAFRVSAVPAYQALARQIGVKRMKRFIDRIGYGNKDISAGIDVFWLNPPEKTPLMISADEQIVLLNRLLDGELPFSRKNIAALKDIMRVVQTEKGTLYGKTGSGTNIGWFVGFVENNDTIRVFACTIAGGENSSGRIAREKVEKILKSLGIL